MTGNNKLGIYFLYFVDLVNLRIITKENHLPEDVRVNKYLFTTILQAPHSKITVKFDEHFPKPFPLQVNDLKLLDISYAKYKKVLKKEFNLSSKTKKIKYKKNKKTHKFRD